MEYIDIASFIIEIIAWSMLWYIVQYICNAELAEYQIQ
jgi:hypothetical protein